MATKSFLNLTDWEQAKQVLTPALEPTAFSLWLEQRLVEKLAETSWLKAGPVVTGSWARHELCPKSDLDVVFTGCEKAIKEVVEHLIPQGLKLRYRVPLNPKDWTQGVQAFDILALYQGRGLTPDSQARLDEQLEKMRRQSALFKRSLYKALLAERRARHKRYDSVVNFLEPNLKFGSGGLRDLEQALLLANLYPERVDAQALEDLLPHKEFFLRIRQKLHLDGSSDQLVATEQQDLADWYGYANRFDFMKAVQTGIQSVSFLADVVVESGGHKPRKIKAQPFKTIQDMLSLVVKDPSLPNQYRIASSLAQISEPLKITASALEQLFSVGCKEASLVAAFRSGLLCRIFPHMRRLRGWVQHDQYHRYTADAHVVLAVREVLRVARTPNRIGKLKKYARDLTSQDWRILIWTALYHDMGKGLGGDHSEKGQVIARDEMKEWGVAESVIEEVCWLIANHLLLSQAAFRKNPNSPSTWRELHQRDLQLPRLRRLVVFTAIDIRATNPDAWTRWKETLLLRLAETLESPQTERYFGLLNQVRREHGQISQVFLDALDPSIVQYVPARLLIEDFKNMDSQKRDLSPLVWRSRHGETWVRLHSHRDRPGLFAEFVQRLYDAGMQIVTASVQTYSEWGAYDWFQVKTSRSKAQLSKILKASTSGLFNPVPLLVRFDSIQVMGQDRKEWVIAFRGRDQKGALRCAAHALLEENLAIQWARVHTWGRDLEDVFGVEPNGLELESLMTRLTEKWVKP